MTSVIPFVQGWGSLLESAAGVGGGGPRRVRRQTGDHVFFDSIKLSRLEYDDLKGNGGHPVSETFRLAGGRSRADNETEG